MDQEEQAVMEMFFRECLDKKKLYRVKDVSYNKDTGVIIDIPSLVYTKSKKHFTLKNTDKRASTLNSLTPKKMITKDRSSKHEI